MNDWNSISKLAYKILFETYKDYNYELLSDAYIAWDKAVKSYDPSKGAFTTHYAMTLRGHISDMYKYSGLVHIPVNKKKTELYSTTSLDTPINESGDTLGDILISETDDSIDLTDKINKVIKISENKTGKLKESLNHIINKLKDDEYIIPRSERCNIYNARQFIKERMKNETIQL